MVLRTLASTYEFTWCQNPQQLKSSSPEDGDSTVLRNVGIYLRIYMMLTPTTEVIQPWRWRQYGSSKRWHLLTNLHGVKTHSNWSYPALKMETVRFSETLASTYESTWCQNPQQMKSFNPEDGDSTVLRNFGIYLRIYMVSKPTATEVIQPWRWRQYGSPKRWHLPTNL
jgi:hypothetical protein